MDKVGPEVDVLVGDRTPLVAEEIALSATIPWAIPLRPPLLAGGLTVLAADRDTPLERPCLIAVSPALANPARGNAACFFIRY